MEKDAGFRRQRVVWICLCLLLCTGCMGRGSSELPDPFMEPWRAMAEVSEGYSPTAATPIVQYPDFLDGEARTYIEQEDSVMPAMKAFPATPMTLRMQDVDIAVLLRVLCRSVERNVVMSPGVQGRTSLNIVDAPWKEVFLSLLNAHDLTFVEEGSMLRILTREERAAQLASEHRVRVAEPLVTAVVHVDYADPEALGANLRQFLQSRRDVGRSADGGPDGSAVMVDKNTQSLMIQATRTDLGRILQLIKHLDRPTPQVLLEAHIVEATRDTARELGVQWGGAHRMSSHWIKGGNQAGWDVNAGDASFDPSAGNVVNFPVDLSEGGFSLGYLFRQGGSSLLSVQLSALESQGRLNILSRPSITTLNNQTAIIESGREVPYQSVEDGETKIEFKKAAVRLEVLPHVIDHRTLRLEIKTNKDELDWTNAVAGNPAIITKRAETRVVLFDGQTTVIGGLNKEKESRGETGVPFLRNIPLLGHLFKGSTRGSETEELLIFITPRILKTEAGMPGLRVEPEAP
ncbi:type IV pilus secretin PilQ [Desulfobotulus sp. H1]|uniref:Type IV pilus secretin PilQ n=1 Tax=Desulfobotulus pelophilus TaxID=2823377 RepID=A0ABT3NAH1_9BACT|nr:type IV pilus secretin PilQ [Desulfobotulus pelophilus]MCW7754468.1 type IV pilus secretin PilQ [Desulfobotulus pelophilus]